MRWSKADSRLAATQPIEMPKRWSTEGCISNQGRLILVGVDGTDVILRFVDDGGEPVLRLKGDLAVSDVARSDLEHSNLHGAVPRFVPFLVSDATGRNSIGLVDLTHREVVWMKSAGRSLDVFRVGARWYVTGTERLTVIDGETGVMVTAQIVGASTVRPDAVTGVLWLQSKSEIGVGRLDATTLRTLSSPPSIRVELDAEGEL